MAARKASSRRLAFLPSRTLVFFALVFVVYTCVYPYLGALNNPNENVRVYMTMAIVEEHTFRIDKILERHGYVNDMAKAPDPITHEPHLYSIKAPAVSLLGAPFYWAFTKLAPHFGHPVPTPASTQEEKAWWFRATVFVLRLFVLQLPCFFFLVWYERFLRAVAPDPALRLPIVAAAGLGTNFLAYALMFVSHSFFGLTSFVAFGIIARERALSRGVAGRRRASMAFLAGLFAGLATLSEYQAFPVSTAIALFAFTVFYRPTRLLAFLAGAGLNAAVLMFYQWRCYANPLTPGHKMAENAQFAAWHQSGFFGLGEPSWSTFRDLSFSHTFGFFGTSPFMWLGLLAIPFGLVWVRGPRRARSQRRTETFWWVFAMLALWIPISCAVNWRGGWTLGPRFFGAAPAFLGFGAACALEHIARASRRRRAIVRGVAGGLALASVVSLGFVGLVFNTFPESVTRPLTQMALPLARSGFVPHHAGELVGWSGTTFWYVVVLFLFGAVLLAAFVPARERRRGWVLRVPFFVLAVALGLWPILRAPTVEDEAETSLAAHAQDLRFFAVSWEPPGRDRISTLRAEAERYGPRGPCLWLRIADLEHELMLEPESSRDAEKAGGTRREACKLPVF